MVNLFAPYRIGNLELKNRFVRSATYDGLADDSGGVTDASVARYEALGKGGVGLIITGFAYVSTSGQALPRQYGAYSDDLVPGLRHLVRAAHAGGAKIALQIVHAGINSLFLPYMGKTCLAVSKKVDIAAVHHELNDAEIEGLITDFVHAAIRGKTAGFDAVQIHGAQNYLLSQFLSPQFNRRTDKWGGSPENRRRFHVEIIRRIREELGNEFPLLIKLGIADNFEGGLDLQEGLTVARKLVESGINGIEVSWGIGQGYVLKKNEMVRTPQRERAAALKRNVNVPVIVVEGIRSLQVAQDIVDSGDADMVSLARPLIREPGLIARWQRGDTRPSDCATCNRCITPVEINRPIQCRKIDS